MKKIAVISKDEDLLAALQSFASFFKMELEFVRFDKSEKPESIDLILTLNINPELLDGLRFLISLRGQESYIGIPVVFVSDELSEAGNILYKDVELVERVDHL